MEESNAVEFVCEENGINMKNEKSLHSSVKKWYAQPGDRLEVKVDGNIIDIVRGNELIEIQTRNFSAISRKLYKLCKNHKVRLVYPVAREKWIVRTDAYGNILGRRKSPKNGCILDLFSELIRIPNLINEENFSVEVLLISIEEIRCDDGKGSWRRKGVSIGDRRLIDVYESTRFETRKDFLRLLPENLSQPFSNKTLSEAMNIPVRMATKVTYCLKKMEAIKEIGKKGNELLYSLSILL